MSPVSRSDRRYAAGSHMTRGDYPRECAVCGEPTRLDDCWQETIGGVSRSYHHACRLALGRAS